MDWQQLLELTQEMEPITTLFTVILSLLIVVLTFIQSQINKRTLEEMKIGRIQMVSPHLIASNQLVKKGFADAELPYFFDMKASCNLSPYMDDKSRVEFDIAFHNVGKGAAYNPKIVKIDGVSEITADTDISIIDIDSQKQVRFELEKPSDLKTYNTICIRYEDVFGTTYEQEIGVKLGQVFEAVESVSCLSPNIIKKWDAIGELSLHICILPDILVTVPPKELEKWFRNHDLDPKIPLEPLQLFADGRFNETVWKAAEIFGDYVQAQSGLNTSGRDLMANAFGDDTHTDVSGIQPENRAGFIDGHKSLAMGAMAAIRNIFSLFLVK